ncbi:MAG TPA: response regulator transcription factor [Vicinamibacteria bacterium]|jgi:two-component system response regulator NreC|nr:response regulator transcription factor [Vicinamibacteria bacterium]
MNETIRVLICEDHALFREGLRAILRDHTHIEIVGDATTGREAVEKAKRQRPDVVLMDLEMPEMSGLEATRRIVQADPGVKVLVLTLYDDEEVVARCLDAGAAGYVLKDGPSDQLLQAMEAVHKGQRYLSPAVLTKVVDYSRRKGRTRTRYDVLTPREREVLKLLADGHPTKEIAARLDLSVKTADVHKTNLMRKLDIHDRAGLVKYAIQRKLIRVPIFDEGA